MWFLWSPLLVSWCYAIFDLGYLLHQQTAKTRSHGVAIQLNPDLIGGFLLDYPE